MLFALNACPRTPARARPLENARPPANARPRFVYNFYSFLDDFVYNFYSFLDNFVYNFYGFFRQLCLHF